MSDRKTVLDFELTRDAVFLYTQARIRLCAAACNSGRCTNAIADTISARNNGCAWRDYQHAGFDQQHGSCDGEFATHSKHPNTDPSGTAAESS